jgi:hypothetical protein
MLRARATLATWKSPSSASITASAASRMRSIASSSEDGVEPPQPWVRMGRLCWRQVTLSNNLARMDTRDISVQPSLLSRHDGCEVQEDALRRVAGHVTLVQRTPQWIAPMGNTSHRWATRAMHRRIPMLSRLAYDGFRVGAEWLSIAWVKPGLRRRAVTPCPRQRSPSCSRCAPAALRRIRCVIVRRRRSDRESGRGAGTLGRLSPGEPRDDDLRRYLGGSAEHHRRTPAWATA